MKKIAASALAALTAVTLAAAPAGASPREVRPGTPVPFEAPFMMRWLEYDVVRPGESNPDSHAVEVLGSYPHDYILCLWSKGGIGECHMPGMQVTDLGPGRDSVKRVTVDPAIAFFAPVFRLRGQFMHFAYHNPFLALSARSSF
ncbi:hypothetical protein M5J20_10640 [Corynebacterium sp. TA-R-1]|uniref:Uncharacterized protein n=1 Tax=Corynebacterium stercoris TaxID=2943490 RepID=A0ABT1G3N1_9CORY|nr:hypothetical protein [Corynebacterium stercoris]MCP1388630.1 hypothetical protein [Corynebacterium stercoris]